MTQDGRLTKKWIVILVVMPLAASIIVLGVGRMAISPAEVLAVLRAAVLGLFGSDSSVASYPDIAVYKTIVNLRLPRIILAVLVGAGLSVAGGAFQTLFSNPLATPDTIGVASGAGFGAALAILGGWSLLGIQVAGILMGCIAVFLTWLAGTGRGRSGAGLSYIVLSGIMIGSLFSALISFTKYVADAESELPAITYWLMGGLDKANYRTLGFGAPIIMLGIVIFWLIRWRMNILPLSDDEARSSGVNIRMLRLVTVVTATAIVASCVSMCGQVGWVGLLVPHMARMKFGSNHLATVPASISFGATFMVIVDTVARSATASEIPISILTAIIGAPFFIILMRRTGSWRI